MATANSKLKIDYGFDAYGNSNVDGTLTVSGDVSVTGNLSFSGTTVGNFIPDADQRNLGNTVNRWNLVGYSANLASTLTVTGATSLEDTLAVTKTISGGNTTITGFANISTSVNSALLTVGTSFIANTTGVYHSGTINAASFTTTGLLANTTVLVATSNTILLGNTIGRFVISANTIDASGDVTITGNTTVNNATLNGTVQTISGNVNFDSGTLFVDSINNRVGLGITTPGVSFDVSGSANISTSVNSALLTVGTSFIANTTGAYHSGTINAASHTVGSNFVANSSGLTSDGSANLTAATSTIRVGNSSVNSFINSTAISTSIGSFSANVSVGSNLVLSTSSIQIGNTTANLITNSVLISVASATSTSNISPSGFAIGSFNANTSTVTVNVGSFVISANVGSNVNLSTTDLKIGNSTSNIFANSILLKVADSSSIANLTPASLAIGSAVVNSTVLTIGTGNFSTGANVGANININTTAIFVGNTTVSAEVTSSAITVGTGNFGLAANVGANVKLTTVILTIGNTTVNSSVNSTGVFTTGVVNGALLTVSTNFIANSTGAYHAGTINAASFTTTGLLANATALIPTSNTILLGNSIGRFVLSANSGNFSGAVTSSGGVNPASNTTGTALGGSTARWVLNANTGDFSGAVNAASFTTTGLVANTTALVATSNTILLGNTIGRFVLSGNTGNFSGAVTMSSLGVGTAATATAGEIVATNNITAYYSDERLKTRLGPITDPLLKLSKLSGFYYQANEIAQSLGYEVKREVGVSAQEVNQVQPEVVAPAPIDNKYLTVRYERLVPLLIEAIKELKTEVDVLKVQINELTNGNS